MSFWNVKDGPIVVEAPPAKGGSIAGNIVIVWQMPLEDAWPEGADKGKGGKYLITPPGYKGKVPAGYFHLPSDSFSGFALLRSNLRSHNPADIATSRLWQADQDLPGRRQARKRTGCRPIRTKFELLFRLYGPEKPLFDKSWELPDVERVTQP